MNNKEQKELTLSREDANLIQEALDILAENGVTHLSQSTIIKDALSALLEKSAALNVYPYCHKTCEQKLKDVEKLEEEEEQEILNEFKNILFAGIEGNEKRRSEKLMGLYRKLAQYEHESEKFINKIFYKTKYDNLIKTIQTEIQKTNDKHFDIFLEFFEVKTIKSFEEYVAELSK